MLVSAGFGRSDSSLSMSQRSLKLGLSDLKVDVTCHMVLILSKIDRNVFAQI